jgi:tRNA(fMet)-specific endonuclease VapC
VSFLVDTDVCSAHLREHGGVSGKFRQHSGSIYVSVITVGELFSWAFRLSTPAKYRSGIEELLSDLIVLNVDDEIARRFGIIRSGLLDQAKPAPPTDLFIAATALVHGLALVTHNTRHFGKVPGIRLVDWLEP